VVSKVGQKNDAGKPRLSLVHGSLLRACARALEHGLAKYGVEPNNWQKVPDARTRYLDAMLRHIHSLADGEEVDPDSGLHHLDSIVANAMFMCYFLEQEDEPRYCGVCDDIHKEPMCG